MRRRPTFLILTGSMVAMWGCPPMMGTNGSGLMFVATLSGDQETPPISVAGYGLGMFELNAAQTELKFDVTAMDLTGEPTAAHFHNAPAGELGDVVFDISDLLITNKGAVSYAGTWMLTAADVAALLAGNIYVNIHTEAHGGGEVRGQLVPAN